LADSENWGKEAVAMVIRELVLVICLVAVYRFADFTKKLSE